MTGIDFGVNLEVWVERALEALQERIDLSVANAIDGNEISVVFALNDSLDAAIVLHQVLGVLLRNSPDRTQHLCGVAQVSFLLVTSPLLQQLLVQRVG